MTTPIPPHIVEEVAKALEPFFSSADKAYREHYEAATAAIEAYLRVRGE